MSQVKNNQSFATIPLIAILAHISAGKAYGILLNGCTRRNFALYSVHSTAAKHLHLLLVLLLRRIESHHNPLHLCLGCE